MKHVSGYDPWLWDESERVPEFVLMWHWWRCTGPNHGTPADLPPAIFERLSGGCANDFYFRQYQTREEALQDLAQAWAAPMPEVKQ